MVNMTEMVKRTYRAEGVEAELPKRAGAADTCMASVATLPAGMPHKAASKKYADAVKMYAESEMPLCMIAKRCRVTPAGLSNHIARYHRELLLKRYGLREDDFSVKVKKRRGQSAVAYAKYKDAISACSDLAYIEYNISQIAGMFRLNAASLAAQLRYHYQDVIPNRERMRALLGFADNKPRGARRECAETYARAVKMYRDTEMTICEVAEACDVSPGGLSQHLRFYHKAVIEHKEQLRERSVKKVGHRKPGKLSGNGHLYGPKPETQAKYADALELFRTTGMTIRDIVAATHVPYAGFAGYLHQWHRGEKLRRRGYEWDGESDPDLQGTKHFLKSTATKYADAIESLKTDPRPVAKVAAEFGLNPEIFREYLKTHEPALAASQGMTRLANGRLVKRSSAEKYAPLIREYATTAESLKSIAERHGIIYRSIYGYVVRNCPDEREAHRRLVEGPPRDPGGATKPDGESGVTEHKHE